MTDESKDAFSQLLTGILIGIFTLSCGLVNGLWVTLQFANKYH